MKQIQFMLFLIVFMGMIGCAKQSPLTSLQESSLAAPPQTVAMEIDNYVPQPGDQLQNLFVSNFSVKVNGSQLQLSTARDGMSDLLKEQLNSQYGFTTSSPESVVTGFADLVLFDLGIDHSQQSLMYCPSSEMLSSTNDGLAYNDARLAGSPVEFLGLRDCEKSYLGLNPSKFDFDGDGIPDYLELRCGLNPADPNDAKASTAGDGVSNLQKCQQNIPIDQSAFSQPSQLFAYHYETQVNKDGSNNFVVSNIPVLNNAQDNFIAFYLVESNISTGAESLYTAFAILKSGYVGKTLKFNYWATQPSNFFDQEINVP